MRTWKRIPLNTGKCAENPHQLSTLWQIVIVWKIGELSHLPVIFVDSCFIHLNWILDRAKDGLDRPLIWLIAATLFFLYSAQSCWARYISFMLSGPILWFHPDLNLSVYSRILPTPLNAQRRNELYSKAVYGTRIREDMSVNKVS